MVASGGAGRANVHPRGAREGTGEGRNLPGRAGVPQKSSRFTPVSQETSQLEKYDAIVIGAGQAGVPLSTALAGAGKRTLSSSAPMRGHLHQRGLYPDQDHGRERPGGVPRAARQGLRRRDRGVRVDLARVRERKRNIVESFRGGSERRLKAAEGLDLVFGEARFTGPRSIAVDGRRSMATRCSSTPGAAPRPRMSKASPPSPRSTRPPSWSSTASPSTSSCSAGDTSGSSSAQMFRRFGAASRFVQRGPQLLPLEDEDVAAAVLGVLGEDGVEVLLQAEASSAERLDGGVRVTVRTSAGDRPVVGSHVLLAAGRVPNTDRLDPKAAGIDTDSKGFIRVNERLETSVAGVYALGDVKGGPAFTHISYDDYRIIRDNLLRGDPNAPRTVRCRTPCSSIPSSAAWA